MQFKHPERCIYLLGAEDAGLSRKALEMCYLLVQLPGDHCMNVSVAGSIMMYDRLIKQFVRNDNLKNPQALLPEMRRHEYC